MNLELHIIIAFQASQTNVNSEAEYSVCDRSVGLEPGRQFSGERSDSSMESSQDSMWKVLSQYLSNKFLKLRTETALEGKMKPSWFLISPDTHRTESYTLAICYDGTMIQAIMSPAVPSSCRLW